MAQINGSAKEQFERVRRAFQDNFDDGTEIGASCAVFHKGEIVVDLWGGFKDKAGSMPWETDTVACLFSTTKGLASACMAAACSRGLLDLDSPVSEYWEEFAQNGKENISVRQLFNHQAGLSAINEYLTPEKLKDLDFMAGVLAKQKPAWDPGTRHGYHGTSLGFFQNELLRRVDPEHRSISVFLREEIAGKLDADLFVGLPETFDEDRIAEIIPFQMYDLLLQINKVPTKMVLSLMNPWSLVFRSLARIKMKGPGDIAGKKYRHLEFPSANGYSNARSLANLFCALACGGAVIGLSPAVLSEISEKPVAPVGGIRDLIFGLDMRYALGFFKPSPHFHPSLPASSFGSMGAGGSIAIGDPENELGFSYVMNKMSVHMGTDPRAVRLLKACYDCV